MLYCVVVDVVIGFVIFLVVNNGVFLLVSILFFGKFGWMWGYGIVKVVVVFDMGVCNGIGEGFGVCCSCGIVLFYVVLLLKKMV